MVEISVKEDLQLVWFWVREFVKEVNQLLMIIIKLKWLFILKLYII